MKIVNRALAVVGGWFLVYLLLLVVFSYPYQLAFVLANIIVGVALTSVIVTARVLRSKS